jgi:hypothetical protein
VLCLDDECVRVTGEESPEGRPHLFDNLTDSALMQLAFWRRRRTSGSTSSTVPARRGMPWARQASSLPWEPTAVGRAALDPALRGQVIEVGGPATMTLNQLARMVSPGSDLRHIPRTLLRVMAVAARPVQPQLARLARAALVMDTADQTLDPGASHTAYPWLTSTPVTPERLSA